MVKSAPKPQLSGYDETRTVTDRQNSIYKEFHGLFQGLTGKMIETPQRNSNITLLKVLK